MSKPEVCTWCGTEAEKMTLVWRTPFVSPDGADQVVRACTPQCAGYLTMTGAVRGLEIDLEESSNEKRET